MSAAELKEYLKTSVESRENFEIMKEILGSVLQETSPEGVRGFFGEAKDILHASPSNKQSGTQKPLVIEVLRAILLTPQTSPETLDIFSKHKVYSTILNSIVPGKNEVEFPAHDQASAKEYMALAKSLVYDLAQFFPGNNSDSPFVKYFESCLKKGVKFDQMGSPETVTPLPPDHTANHVQDAHSTQPAGEVANKLAEVIEHLGMLKQELIVFGQTHATLNSEAYDHIGGLVQEMLNLTEHLSDQNLERALAAGLTQTEKQELQQSVSKYRVTTETLANAFDVMDPNDHEDYQVFRRLLLQLPMLTYQKTPRDESLNDSLDANRSRNHSMKMSSQHGKPPTPKEGSKSGSHPNNPSLPKLPLSQVLPQQELHKPPVGMQYEASKDEGNHSQSSLRDQELKKLVEQAQNQKYNTEGHKSQLSQDGFSRVQSHPAADPKNKPASQMDLEREMAKLNQMINARDGGPAVSQHNGNPAVNPVSDAISNKKSMQKISHINQVLDPSEEMREFDAPKERTDRHDGLHAIKNSHQTAPHLSNFDPKKSQVEHKSEGMVPHDKRAFPEVKDHLADSNWIPPQELSQHGELAGLGRSLDKDRLGYLENFDPRSAGVTNHRQTSEPHHIITNVNTSSAPIGGRPEPNPTGSLRSVGKSATQNSGPKSPQTSQLDKSKHDSTLAKGMPVGAQISFKKKPDPTSIQGPNPPVKGEDFGRFYEQQVSQRVRPIIEESPEDNEESARGASHARPLEETVTQQASIKVRDTTRVEKFPLPGHLEADTDIWGVSNPSAFAVFSRPSDKPIVPSEPKQIPTAIKLDEVQDRPPRLRTDLKSPQKTDMSMSHSQQSDPKEPQQYLSRATLEREKELLKKSFENRYSQLHAQVQKLTSLLEEKQKVPSSGTPIPSRASVPVPHHVIPQATAHSGTVMAVTQPTTTPNEADKRQQTELVREVSYLRMLVDQNRTNNSMSRDYNTISAGGAQDLSRTFQQGAPNQQELVDKIVRFAAGEEGIMMNKHLEDQGNLFENTEIKVDLKLEKNLVLRDSQFFIKGKITVLNKTTEFLRNLNMTVKDSKQVYKMMVKPSFAEVTLDPLASISYTFLASPRSPSVKVPSLPVLSCSYTPPNTSTTAVSPVRPISLCHVPVGLHRYFLPDHSQSPEFHTNMVNSAKWEVYDSPLSEITNLEMRMTDSVMRIFGLVAHAEQMRNLSSAFSSAVWSAGTYRFQDFRLLICLKLTRAHQVKISITFLKEFPTSMMLSGSIPVAGVTPLDVVRELADSLTSIFTTAGH